jgi:hypothetical protein
VNRSAVLAQSGHFKTTVGPGYALKVVPAYALISIGDQSSPDPRQLAEFSLGEIGRHPSLTNEVPDRLRPNHASFGRNSSHPG